MVHIAAHLNAEIILVVTSLAVRYISSLSPLPSYCRYHVCEPDVKLDSQQEMTSCETDVKHREKRNRRDGN